MTIKFIRTCQECGARQTDTKPVDPANLRKSYTYRKCKKCKSEALDFGSDQDVYDDTLAPIPACYDCGKSLKDNADFLENGKIRCRSCGFLQ